MTRMSDRDIGVVCTRSDGPITEADREAVRRFAEFLRDVGPPGGDITQRRRRACLKHADYLGLTDDERQRIQAKITEQDTGHGQADQ